MKHIGLAERVFNQTNQFYMKDTKTHQIIMQAQMGASDATPPSISRQKAKEIFIESEEKKFENIAKMMQKPQSQSMISEEDHMSAVMETMV
jgi:hypothetical protein